MRKTLAEYHQNQTKLKKYGIKNPLEANKMAKNEEKEEKEEKQMPEKKFRMRGVTATIWKNIRKKDDEEFEVFNVDIIRNYLDKDGKWQTTSSFQLNDLPSVAKLAEKAYEHLTLKSE